VRTEWVIDVGACLAVRLNTLTETCMFRVPPGRC